MKLKGRIVLNMSPVLINVCDWCANDDIIRGLESHRCGLRLM